MRGLTRFNSGEPGYTVQRKAVDSWFWCAWPGIRVAWTDGAVRTGYETSQWQAEKHARAAFEQITGKPANSNYIPPAPRCIIDLGLDWPCTLEDVQRRWRTLAKVSHPDLGGNATQFIVARKAYEEAIELLGGAT